VTARPDCRVELRVVAQETAAPVERVHVHLGCYQARTDSHGHARLDLAAGEYMLELWKSGFALYTRKLRVTNEVGPRVITVSAADDDPDTDQVWM